MKKRISKKILALFFVIATLMPFGFIKPMKKQISNVDPCERPSEGTKITDLSVDSLGVVFQFFSQEFKELCLLRLVCKGDFEQAVKKVPVSLTIDGEKHDKIPYNKWPFGEVTKLTIEHIHRESLVKKLPDNFLNNVVNLTLRTVGCVDLGDLSKKISVQNLQALHLEKICSCEMVCCPNLNNLVMKNICNFSLGSTLSGCFPNLRKLEVAHCLFDVNSYEVSKQIEKLKEKGCVVDIVDIKCGSKNTDGCGQCLYHLKVTTWRNKFKAPELENLHTLRVQKCNKFIGFATHPRGLREHPKDGDCSPKREDDDEKSNKSFFSKQCILL